MASLSGWKCRLIGFVCVSLVAGAASVPGFGAEGTRDLTKLKSAVLAIPTGSPMQVQMKDKSKATGKLGSVDNEAFDLQTIENGNIVTRRVSFDQVQKVSAGAPKGKLKAMGGPLFTIMGLLGTVGAVTAAIR